MIFTFFYYNILRLGNTISMDQALKRKRLKMLLEIGSVEFDSNDASLF